MRRIAWWLQDKVAALFLFVFCRIMAQPVKWRDANTDVLSSAIDVWMMRHGDDMHEHVRCHVCSSRDNNSLGWSVEWFSCGYTLRHHGYALYGYPHTDFNLDESDLWDESDWDKWYAWCATVADECEWSALWSAMYV